MTRFPLYLTLLALVLAAAPPPAGAAQPSRPQEKILLIKDYRFKPAAETKNMDIGQSLCGTRCNALATDYLTISEPGGWRLIRTAVGKEITVELGNPFLAGECVCVADEYSVIIDDLTTPRR